MLTRKCRATLTCCPLLRPFNRTKSSAANSESSKFERDAAPHHGLDALADAPQPRVLTSRPSARQRDCDVSQRQNKDAAPRRVPPSRILGSPVGQTHLSESQRQIQNGTKAQYSLSLAKSRTSINQPLTIDSFFHPTQSVSIASNSERQPNSSSNQLPSEFTSPPLLPALHKSLMETLGPFARPTPIQSLSLEWILDGSEECPSNQPNWRQFFLASETGSGKSIAYLLPVLQSIKQAELAEKGNPRSQSTSKRLYNPRGLILAPTHELSRQLSGFAKSLLHELKLRVQCGSQANNKSTNQKHATSRKMLEMFDDVEGSGEFTVSTKKGGHGVDLLVGTPMKLLEMFRGRGWDKIREKEEEEEKENEKNEEEASVDGEGQKKFRRGRDFAEGFGRAKTVELGLANVEWVVIDEADVLLDPDFHATTRLLLSDISAARGHHIPLTPAPELGGPFQQTSPPPTPVTYPFNLILTSATIPNSLNNYLQNHHPSLVRLSSPDLHHLPKTLETEHVSWSGGNKFADIHRRIRQIWAEDAASSSDRTGTLSKVLIFCNKSSKVTELSEYLEQQDVKCLPMTSASQHRKMGSNRHLAEFMRKPSVIETVSSQKALKRLRRAARTRTGAPAGSPLVMVTTSLLSRGLDFSPEVKHVFIVDEPRNMVDFLHRAGRSGRAGHKGKVVVFGKLSGRGSERGREIRKRVVGLKTRSKGSI